MGQPAIYSMNTDYTFTDNPRCLYAAAAANEFPEWVEKDGIPTREELEGMAKQAFADTERRLLPMHTKTAAFYSAIDFFSRPDQFSDDVHERIKAACDMYGITAEIPEYTQVFVDTIEKQASEYLDTDISDFALDCELNGTEIRLFPIYNKSTIEDSIVSLNKMAHERRLPHPLVKSASEEIRKAASVYDVEVYGVPAQLEVDRFEDWEKAASLVQGRGKDPVIQEAYDNLIKAGAEGTMPVDEILDSMQALDYSSGVVYNYTNPRFGERTPEEVVYCGESKEEAVKMAKENVLISGVAVPVKAWNEMSEQDVRTVLGGETADVLKCAFHVEDGMEASYAVSELSDEEQKNVLKLLLAVNE